MSFIIKKDIPASCTVCDDIGVNALADCPWFNPEPNERHENCPLIEIPKGHKIVDITALGIGKANKDTFVVPEYADGWNSAIELINNAPTILEEE